jgi:hypothetical protein
MLKAQGVNVEVDSDHPGLTSKGAEVAPHSMRSLRSRGKRWASVAGRDRSARVRCHSGGRCDRQ